MITILASPKPFVGEASEHQRNAIRSWLALAPDIEVILFGDASGTAEAAGRLGVAHVPTVECSGQGTPYFGAIADYAERHGRYDTQAYVNCDIVVTKTLLSVMERVPFRQFLIVGQRIDLPEGVMIDATQSGWKDKLLDLAENGRIDFASPFACDYFVFRRGLWRTLPPTVIGRAAFDNALIAHCLRSSLPVIDATWDVIVAHPFHGYAHVAGGQHAVWHGDDARLNLEGIGSCPAPGVWDATWQSRNGHLRRAWGHGDWLRAAEIHARLVWQRDSIGLVLALTGRCSRRLGVSRGHPIITANTVVYRLLKSALSAR
jgi:hypothetical protein